MIYGVDTGFLVAAEVAEHAEHSAARTALARLFASGDFIAIAPQVLTEFIHVVTDPRRFSKPLGITQAQQVAERWWTAQEVMHVFPDVASVRQFLTWLQQHSLGRKRLLDTLWPPPWYKLALIQYSRRIQQTSRSLASWPA